MFNDKEFKKFLANYTEETTGGLYKDFVQDLEDLESLYKMYIELTKKQSHRWSDLIKIY